MPKLVRRKLRVDILYRDDKEIGRFLHPVSLAQFIASKATDVKTVEETRVMSYPDFIKHSSVDYVENKKGE